MPTQAKPSRPARLSRADQKLKRTEEILDAAWKMFCEKGYEGTTIDDVAELAGVSRYPVFYAFSDKQNLFLELWRRKVKEVFDIIEPRIRRGAALSANLRALAQLVVEDHASSGQRNADNLFFVVQTQAFSRPDIATRLEEISTSIVDYIAGIIESSALEPGCKLRAPARTVAANLAATISGLGAMRFQTHLVAVNVDDLFDTFSTIVVKPSRK